MAVLRLEINQQIPSVSKKVTQESIDLFESCGILERQNIHNNQNLAKQRLGYAHPIASGRMSVAFAAESLRRFFGAGPFNHTGTVDLKFLRPVKNGDTITVRGSVIQQERVDGGTLVTVEVYCQNQDGDKTAIGTGTAIIP